MVPIKENGEPDAFYRNLGGTNFQAVAFESGVFRDANDRPLPGPPLEWGLSVMFRDLNHDGFPDLFVCNDFDANDRVWINDGAGHFRPPPPFAFRKSSHFSMSVDVADINRDGWDDIFVVDMLSREHVRRMIQTGGVREILENNSTRDDVPSYKRNTLFLQRPGGRYSEIAEFAGLAASEWSWCVLFLDVDLDGYEDVLITNGNERDGLNVDVGHQIEKLKSDPGLSAVEKLRLRRLFPRLDTGNLAFRNRDGLRFEEMSEPWGFNLKGVSHGMALADLDNDGDLDVVVNNLNAPAAIYRNNASAARVSVRLKGKSPNTQAIGARITVEPATDAKLPVQSQVITCGGPYLSSSDTLRTFAAETGVPMKIVIDWPGKSQTILTNCEPNSLYIIEQDQNASSNIVSAKVSVAPLFEDVSMLLSHTTQASGFDDFAYQPLLPYRLSRSGPALVWSESGENERIELTVGGNSAATFQFDVRSNSFLRVPFPQARYATGPMLKYRASNDKECLIASGFNLDRVQTNASSVRQFMGNHPQPDQEFSPSEAAIGSLAMTSSGASSLLLFAGGRVIPGQYPKAAPSTMWVSSGTGWIKDLVQSAPFKNLGLVSGAVFSDLDGDGLPELVLALEWGPPTVFALRNGVWTNITSQLGLDRFIGWWNGVTGGDFNGDGRMDIAASNWGSNTPYERFRSKPLLLFSGDFNGDGSWDLISAWTDPWSGKNFPMRGFDTTARALPDLRIKFRTYGEYAAAPVEEMIGASVNLAELRRATWLESTVFLNMGDHFEPHILPPEAQFSPAFGISVADFNGDGKEDLFLAQNILSMPHDIARMDAGCGLILKGDGQGEFTALSSLRSGVEMFGEQRSAAVADYDGDGRVDLAVGQSEGSLKLFHNIGATPGLRVRFEGKAALFGTILQAKYGNRFGPAREVHGGAGFWSQDSTTQVLAAPERITELWVRPPARPATSLAVPRDAKEVSISSDYRLKVIERF